MDLKALLDPDSIAVIGASKNRKKLGWQVLNNIQKSGFKGKIYPVNPKHKKINGLTAYGDVTDIKNGPDLAVVVIPAPAVMSVIKSCAQKEVKNIIVISAGFSEAGEKGRQREEELQHLAHKYGVNILGPNCLGLINTANNINATFADFSTPRIFGDNKVAFISQSGAIGSAFFDWGEKHNVGIDYFISVGNKAVLDEVDFFDHFRQEKQVGIVVAYLEEITRGKRFMETVSRLAKTKPVVILKAGRTEAGGQATMSHTGSLAGSQQAVETGLKRSGAIVVDNLEELFNMIKFLQVRSQRNIKDKKKEGEKVYVISNAGGPMVITVDELSRAGLDLPSFPDQLNSYIKKNLPQLTAYHNPLDILGDADSKRYQKALEAVTKKGEASYVLVLLTPQTSTEIDKTAEVIKRSASANPGTMILTSFVGGDSLAGAEKKLIQAPVANFDYPGQAVDCLAKFVDYKNNISNFRSYKYSEDKTVTGKNEHRDFTESLKLLKKYNIPAVKTSVVKKNKDLEGLDYPLILKRVGKEVVHKTEEKALVSDLESPRQAKSAFKDLEKRFNNKGYCIAQPLVSEGVEMILGFKRDESFGSIIIVGWGGVYTEVLRDIETEADDVCKKRAKQAIKNLQVYSVLKGVRGDKGYDMDSVADVMVNLGRLARQNPDIRELDINPLFVRRKGCVAADVRIVGKE